MTTFNIFNVIAAFLFTLFTSGVAALPIENYLQKRDVFVPPILYPHADTVWFSGQTHNVTWDTSDAPVNITNKVGTVAFGFSGIETPLILANGFDILDGRVEVIVPEVFTRDDYFLILFGDSGNFSPNFTINGVAE